MMHAAKGVSQQNHTVGRGRVFRGPLFLLCRNVCLPGTACEWYDKAMRRGRTKTLEKGGAHMPEKHAWTRWFWGVMGACALVQLVLAGATAGYAADYNTFWAWALRVAEEGFSGFYAEGYFADYPPGGILLLWPLGKLAQLLHISHARAFARCLLAAPGILAGVGLAALCYRLAGPGRARGFVLGVAAGASPALLYVTGVWKQMDMVYLLFLVACFAALGKRRLFAAALCWGAALALKPQALILGPVLAVCVLADAWYSPKRLAALGRAAGAGAAALVPALVCGLPFFGVSGLLPGLFEKYFSTAQSYPYASLSAANWFSLLGANWAPQTDRLLFFTYAQWGTLHIAVLTAGLCVLAFRAAKAGRLCPLLLAAAYAAGIFCFAHRMHERYLLMAVFLTLAAAAVRANRQLLAIGCTLGVAAWLNMLLVVNASTSQDLFLLQGLPAFALRATALAVLLCVCMLLWLAVRLSLWPARDEPLQAAQLQNFAPMVGLRVLLARRAARRQPVGPPPVPLRWTRRELALLLAGTLALGAVSFARLGNTAAPQTFVEAQSSLSVTATVDGEAESLMVYQGITQAGGQLRVQDAQGREVLLAQLASGGCFSWVRHALSGPGPYTVTVTGAQVFELAFLDASGQTLPVYSSNGQALFDEQGLVPARPSYENSMYFDEIYHARTAYETVHGLPVYETTHPPLGKDIMALGVALFGMTPFGWRCMGTLFGVLLAPEIYLLARALCRSRRAAALAAVLWGFDFMRFAQSRIGTIDTYAVFFILACSLGMLGFCRELARTGFTRRAWACLAASGAAFGCAAAVKWTGIFAGAGLAVLYFWALSAKAKALRAQPGTRAAVRGLWVRALAGGCALFIFLPLGIYLASYLPLGLGTPQYTLADWWAAQQSMYAYHSALNATHPFESRWFTWPFDLRPVWYYMGGELPQGMAASIACLGNPLVFWGGTAALAGLAVQQARGNGTRAGRAVLVLWAAQILPWVTVSRCTFLYHYFPGAAFGVLALALLWAEWNARTPRIARRAALALAACAGLLFVMFYPALSGLPVPENYARLLLWLPQWQFYSL